MHTMPQTRIDSYTTSSRSCYNCPFHTTTPTKDIHGKWLRTTRHFRNGVIDITHSNDRENSFVKKTIKRMKGMKKKKIKVELEREREREFCGRAEKNQKKKKKKTPYSRSLQRTVMLDQRHVTRAMDNRWSKVTIFYLCSLYNPLRIMRTTTNNLIVSKLPINPNLLDIIRFVLYFITTNLTWTTWSCVCGVYVRERGEKERERKVVSIMRGKK